MLLINLMFIYINQIIYLILLQPLLINQFLNNQFHNLFFNFKKLKKNMNSLNYLISISTIHKDLFQDEIIFLLNIQYHHNILL